MIPTFETTFAVPLSCEACIKAVSTSLYKLDGMNQKRHYISLNTTLIKNRTRY